MFLKPYKLKSNTPLKGSDSKKLRQRLEAEFPNTTADELSALIACKDGKVSLLKIVTQNEFQTNVYCVNKLPMFYEIEGGALAPSLYAIWQLPNLLPYFTTVPGVLPKLSNGADLMLPGVIPLGTGLSKYGHFKKGQLIAINLTSNKSAVAIGYLNRSSDDLYMCGGQGSAVKMIHIFGDKLWGHEPSLVQQIPNQKPADLTSDDFPELGSDTKKKKQPERTEEITVTLSNVITSEENQPKPQELKQMDSIPENIGGITATDTTETNVEPTLEVILKNAFLTALKNHGKSLQLPLLTSNFYRLYVVPEAAQPIDFKKTKYKKLSNFLNEMIDEGFIVVREETKGIDKITFIDLDHPDLVNFITDFKKPPQTVDGEGQEQGPLFHSELTELYIVTDETAHFFTKMNYKRGEGIPATQIKKIIREYINKENLPIADPVTKSIRLDDTLKQICEFSEGSISKICNGVIQSMSHSYQMCSIKDNSSQKPLIQMSLATRSGNKKVTLVSNLECYGIIVSEFIKICKQGAAASTTIVKTPNQKREQLQIQGNQIRFVFNLLTETYKVPPKCILGLELAKDGKKHKKK